MITIALLVMVFAVVQSNNDFIKMAGVWSVHYSNGYRDTYTITSGGSVSVRRKGTHSTLVRSDNQRDFPSSQGWYKMNRIHRPTTWEYVRMNGNTLEIQHFCSDGYCRGRYGSVGSYCCYARTTRAGPGCDSASRASRAPANIRKLVGVWNLHYTNGYRDIYTISPDGRVSVKHLGTHSKLVRSDNQRDFPSSQGWFKMNRIHRTPTWEYVRMKGNTLEIQHFCSDGYCRGRYGSVGHYCCYARTTRAGGGDTSQICVAVNGNWGGWSTFGSCSKKCGGGIQKRTRSCTNPKPAFGGSTCHGSREQSRSCNVGGCPVNGNWGGWSGYSACSKSCGQGTQKRTRSCNNPPPANGGSSCPGSSSQTKRCQVKKCEDFCPGKGWCLTPSGYDQNSGTRNIRASSEDDCFAQCKRQSNAKGCEWSGSLCVVHTHAVGRGSGYNGYSCWVFSKCPADKMNDEEEFDMLF